MDIFIYLAFLSAMLLENAKRYAKIQNILLAHTHQSNIIALLFIHLLSVWGS